MEEEKPTATPEKTPASDPPASPQPSSQSFIGDYHAAPEFMKENEQIQRGYRINFKSKWRLLKSLFMVHNESVNIWSHLLPLLVLMVVIISLVVVVDDHQFKRELMNAKQDLQKVFGEYESSLRNLTQFEWDGLENEEFKFKVEMLKNNIIRNYKEVVQKVDKHSSYFNQLLNQNIQGIKSSLKEELKFKLKDMEAYRDRFQNTIAPRIVEAVTNRFNNSFIDAIREHSQKFKNHLDSNIFRPMELHPDIPNPQLISRWPVFVFLSTAALCLLFSTLFHLFHPLSSKAYGVLLRFDFAGISLLIAGSAFPSFYYSMYCHFAVVEIYLTSTVGISLLCFFISLFEWIHKKENSKYRGVLFGTFALFFVIPLTHLVVNQFVFDNFGDPFLFSSSYGYYFGLIASYIMGLYIFTVKCPERNNPGKYDICGHSHQIWHFMVVLGIVFTYFAAMHNYEMRKQSICPA